MEIQTMTEILTNSGLAIINLKKHLTLKGVRHFIKFTFARKNVFTYPFMNVFFYLKKSNVSFSRYLDFCFFLMNLQNSKSQTRL